ncbi:hypothetical protein P170DRAFT_503010 [Aspergillus steynii IBT 23096]|uniref:C2H2-type domain-containing protein n=1 Tax=Aspergillus steynii IBT 23096 TaxID=1392250 RepID=A0A2I2FUP9_9EURO|nr:uncharacterized protein P170DRAFT_503010 [Aspergillus steynii IBT 23096]PLB44331.1 hypothetical protein P170DRAFT_503010 [Aspergillus steynii IBT 23096]
MNALDHWAPTYECETCDRTFRSSSACDQHMDAKDHWAPTYECETCSKEFFSEQARAQHMNALDHWAPTYECETCDRTFRSSSACDQHMNDLNHWAPTFECETCDRIFKSSICTQSAAAQNVKQTGQYNVYCRQCDRTFKDENSLKMHLNSATHRGRTIVCPFCQTWYTTPSGLTHHLEKAACPSAPALNIETIHEMIRKRDPKGIITMKGIGWYPQQKKSYSASGLAYNGSYWECYICHREFETIKSLNQHLNSPAHQQVLYHCPNYTSQCGRQFTALGALFNHLESEVCSFMRFEKVQIHVEDVISGRGRIAF